MDLPALKHCVGDVDVFLEKHWGQVPLLRAPTEVGEHAFDRLASLVDLDHMVASLGLHASGLRMVKDGQTLAPAKYTISTGKRSRSAEARISAPLVYDLYSEGATIVLESLHRYWEPLTDFCRELEISLGHRLQVNAYITPPGSKGFVVHRDDHDVFILQVSGTKHWIVYDRDDEERVLIDQDIERGSALYIPKGFPHAATTGHSASAHLTVGILTHEAIEIVREVVKLAEEEPTFQDRLPREAASDPGALRRSVSSYLGEMRTWLEKVDVDELTERVARRVVTTSQPIIRGQLSQLELLDSIADDTEVVRRRGATCFLFRKDTVLKVLLADRELEMPLRTVPAMEEIASRDRFLVRDLNDALDPESSVVLVRRLVKEGLLEVVV